MSWLPPPVFLSLDDWLTMTTAYTSHLFQGIPPYLTSTRYGQLLKPLFSFESSSAIPFESVVQVYTCLRAA